MASSFVTDSNGHGSTLISDPALNEPVNAQEVPVKEGEEISFPSQKWLAILVGSSRESANKELKRLHDGGIITVSRQKVRILDATKLKKQADQNATPYCVNLKTMHKPEKYPWLTRPAGAVPRHRLGIH